MATGCHRRHDLAGDSPAVLADLHMRVLVVEDEAIIALDLVEHLDRSGHVAVGPASTATAALKLILEVEIDSAVLDVNLGRETAESVATELRRRDIPFICVSGYDIDQLPDAFCGAPYLVKPLNIDRLLELLSLLWRATPRH